MDLKEIEWVGMDRIHVAERIDWWWAVVKTVLKLQVP
jgi:hypothetical protein